MGDVVRVGVVGGGPAGLLSSIVLSRAGVFVDVFEEHPQVGLPRHCTGLLSSETINSMQKIAGGLSKDFILRSFREYVVRVAGSSKSLTLKIPGKVYVTDRVLLEQELTDVATSEGVNVLLKSRVNGLSSDGQLMASGDVGPRKYDLVILSEGSAMNYSTALRMCEGREYLRALQSVIRVKGHVPGHPLVYVGREVSSSFFGWAVPYRDNGVIVGYADEKASLTKLRKLVRTYLTDAGTVGEEKSFFGGLIPSVKPCKPASGKVVGVGDAIASVKPLTGGGLYPIVKEVEAIPAVINSADIMEYVRRVNPVLNKLRKQYLLKKSLKLFGGYAGIVRVFWELGIRELTVSDYDSLRFRLWFPKNHGGFGSFLT